MYADRIAPGEVDAEACMPQDLHISIRKAIPKLNMCDAVTLALLPHVTDILQKINARVDWLTVDFQPLFQLRDEGSNFSGSHSILSITTSSGEQFIPDFTIEQFGYHERYWLTSKPDYLQSYTMDGSYALVTEEHLDMVRFFAHVTPASHSFQRVADAVLGTFDWTAYSQLLPAARRPWISAAVLAAFKTLTAPASGDGTAPINASVPTQL
ncbi:hypothetical protein NX059_001926 [Plenodomus lindquistii]|nr:hypothetical protein NX059_001926 [Plenodomus lindquistii]